MRSFPALTAITAEAPSTLHLHYSDGTRGDVDLHGVVGTGVFEPLADPSLFVSVSISPEGQVRWSEEMEICADALYLELTGASFSLMMAEEEKPNA